VQEAQETALAQLRAVDLPAVEVPDPDNDPLDAPVPLFDSSEEFAGASRRLAEYRGLNGEDAP
jgi:hypothetical protein